MSKTLTTLKQSRPWIAHIDDERAIGNSIIVTLAAGYDFADDPGSGVKGFDSVTETRSGTRKSEVVSKAVEVV